MVAILAMMMVFSFGFACSGKDKSSGSSSSGSKKPSPAAKTSEKSEVEALKKKLKDLLDRVADLEANQVCILKKAARKCAGGK
jgi:hypothetical protein